MPPDQPQETIDETPEPARAAIVSSIQLTAHLHVSAPGPGEDRIALPTVTEVSYVVRRALDAEYGNEGRVHFTISGAQHV